MPMDYQLILSIEVEQKNGQGEDSAACLVAPGKAAFVAALDGCGGAGSKKYPSADNWTGARIASFSCAQTLADWFYRNRIDELGLQAYPPETIARSLRQALTERIAELKRQTAADTGKVVLSNMVKPFPTTLSAALVCSSGETSRCLMLWAGDSRGYILSGGGLFQITTDDLKGNIDPFDNIEQDGVLSNVVSGNEFQIRVRDLSIRDRCILIVATDGCFGYLRSPMEFEHALLSTLMQARSPKEWERSLSAFIGSHAADDYTLQALAIGFETFDQIKAHYRGAYERFMSQYGACLDLAADRDALKALWDKYKQHYMWGNQ